MKTFLKEYARIIGITITGLVFAYGCFYLFLNFYHYQEVRETYQSDMSADPNYQAIQNNIVQIKSNLDFSVQNYNGSIDRYFITGLQSRLKSCVAEIDHADFQDWAKKTEYSLKDVNTLNGIYRTHVVNNCVVMQITDFLSLSKDKLSSIPSFQSLYNASLLETKFITQSTSYLSNIMKNNSSYYFNTSASRAGVYDPVKDSLSVVLGSYEKATEYVVQVSNWLHSEVTK